MKRDHKTSMLALLFLSLTLILNSCGGGGGASSPGAPPYIIAELDSFPTGSVPPGLMPDGSNSMAAVYVIDDYSGAPIPNAAVTMNGVTLTYDATYQNYGGHLTVAPGESFALRVAVGGSTYTASGTQFTSYPTIAAPAFGASWPTGYDSSIVWSEGTPTAMAYYTRAHSLLGILDAADPNGPLVWPSDGFLDELYFPTTSCLIPANSLTVGNRHVIVGIEAFTAIANAADDSRLYLAGFNSVPITVTNPTLVSIEVTPSDPSIAKGMTQQFTAMGTFSDSTTRDLTTQVYWASSHDSIATISNYWSQGWAYGAGVGNATITATLGSVSDSTTLTVTPAFLRSLVVQPENPAIPKGTTQQFSALGTFSDNTIMYLTTSVTWSSSDTGVATISNTAGTNGLATPVASGATTITATSGSISGSTELTVQWTSRVSGSTNHLHSVVWSGAQFVAVGDSGTILTSPDGVMWTSRTSGSAVTLRDVVWSGTNFVAVGYDTNFYGAILTSPDGVTWTAQTPGSLKFLYGVVWSEAQFVAVGESGTILTSPDGVTWTGQTSGIVKNLYDVAWSGTQFLAVGANNGYMDIYTSPDGVTWTSRSVPVVARSVYGVVWSGTQFVVVGAEGRIFTSPDGVTWTLWTSRNWQYEAMIDDFYAVAWSGSQFVVVGATYSNALPYIRTSSDGVTWALQQAPTGAKVLHGVAWSGTRFVAVGENGTILTSQ
jgi:hypothetical protein